MSKYYFSALMVLGMASLWGVHVYVVHPDVLVSFAEDDEDLGEQLGYGTTFPEVEYDDDEAMFSPREPAGVYSHVSSRRGRRKRPKRGASTNHKGTDYQMSCGTAVPARQSGTVSKTGWAKGYGKLVAINHGGCRAIYAHLSSVRVRKGQHVGGGTIIGRSGRTGISTGCHLHYESCSRLYAELGLPGGEDQQSTPPATPSVAAYGEE